MQLMWVKYLTDHCVAYSTVFPSKAPIKNRINRQKSNVCRPLKLWKYDGPKCRINGAAIGIFVQQVSPNQRHSKLAELAFRRGLTLEPSVIRQVEASASCHSRRMCLPECRKHVRKATHVDGFKKKSND